MLARETVSDSIDGKLPGSQDATAPQGVIMTYESLILKVHDEKYTFPRSYEGLLPCLFPRFEQQHREAKDAILNDGMDPAQLKALRVNRRLYVQADRKVRKENEEKAPWC